MNRMASPVLVAALGVAMLFASASAQQTRGKANQQPATTAAATDGDFTSDGLKFHRMTPAGFNPTTFMVTDIKSSNPAGEMMINAGGPPTIVSFQGFDKATIGTAFAKHGSGGDSQPTEVTTKVSPANTDSRVTGTSLPVGFDTASKTVTLPSGGSVRYIDDKHAEVNLPGPTGMQTYELEYHKGGGMGLAKVWADGASGRGTGSSFGGSGVKITVPSANGMPGGELYDTARGTNVTSGIDRIRPIIAAVTEANASAPDNLRKSTVIRSLEANNLGLH